MQAVKSEKKLLSNKVQRLMIILLVGAVIMATVNVGMTAYASERMVSTDHELDNMATIRTFIQADDGSVTVAGGNKIAQFDENYALKWKIETPQETQIQALSEAGDGGFLFAGRDHNFKFYYGKLNVQGELLWAKSYDNAAVGSANAIYPQEPDRYIVFGDYREELGQQVKPLLLLVDSTGEVIGSSLSPIMDNSLNQNIRHALPLGAGDYLLLGNLSQVSSPNIALAARVSGLEGSLGEVRWFQTYAKGDQHFSFEHASAVSINGETFYLVTGNIFNTVSGQRATLTLLDENGNEQWTETYDQAGSGGVGIHAAMTREGGFVLVGGDNNTNGFLIKTDKEGNEQWRKIWPNTGNIRQVEQNADGSYTMAGGILAGGGIFRHMSVGQPTGLTVDPVNKHILGLNGKMEYSTDGVHYERYNHDNEPVFNGTVNVYVRYAEDLANGFEVGPPTVLSFTRQPIELEEGQIFNQNGRSYSGVITSSPLGNEIEMTAYGDWPEGFTKGEQAFTAAVYDGEYIWMIPYRTDRIIRFHPETGQMTGYSEWPVGFDRGPDSGANGAFFGSVFDGESIWLVPYDANMVVQFNPKTGEINGYNEWPDADEVGERHKFSGGYFDGESIILVPYKSKVLVELNPATGEMIGYNDWPEDLQWGWNGLGFASSVFDGENVWMIPYEANQVVKFNTLTKEMTSYADWPEGINLISAHFIGGAYDGERIWMAPMTTKYVIALDPLTGRMSKYNIWPEGEGPHGSSYYSMFYDGEAVWLIPYNQNAFMRIDPDTGETTLHRNWPEGFSKGLSAFTSSVSDGEHLWAIPFSADKVIRLSSAQLSSKHAVTYDGNGATEGDVPIDTERYEEGETVTVLGNVGQLALPDHRFTGWSLSPSVTDAVYTAGDRFTMGNEDITLYAVWEESTAEQPETYTVRYDGNGATSGHVPVGERTYNNGEQVTVEPNSGLLRRIGYSFIAWNTQQDGSGIIYGPGDQLTIEGADVTLYAMWSPVLNPEPESPYPSREEDVPRPSKPQQRTIKIQLDSFDVTLNASIYQVQGKNGQKVDELRINNTLVHQLKQALKTEEAQSIRFLIREANAKLDADEFVISLTPSALEQLSSLNVQIEFDLHDVVQTMTSRQLTNLKQHSQAVQLRFVLPDQAQKMEQVQAFIDAVESSSIVEEGRAELISEPVIVEVSTDRMKNFETLLTFPLDHVLLPKEEQLRKDYLESLFVYVVHDDGTFELVKGDLLQDSEHNVAGIQIKVNRFSTFAVVRVVPNAEVEHYEPYINGYADGTFKPSRPLTRAELAVMIEHFLTGTDVSDDSSRSLSFHDVKQEHWAAEAIQKVSQAGIMTGIGDGSFMPNKAVTRAEFAAVLARWKQLSGGSGSIFKDVHEHWAAHAISMVHQQGWMKGYEDGTYRPNRALTRAEAVKALNAVLGRPPMDSLDQPKWSDVPASHWAWSEIESASQTFQVKKD